LELNPKILLKKHLALPLIGLSPYGSWHDGLDGLWMAVTEITKMLLEVVEIDNSLNGYDSDVFGADGDDLGDETFKAFERKVR
jgi:hypothetical protein